MKEMDNKAYTGIYSIIRAHNWIIQATAGIEIPKAERKSRDPTSENEVY